ncbi:universal stress protein [Pseudomonas aeruginosa]
MTHVMACIDGSPSAAAVCDYATWASQRLQAPLTLLHVVDRSEFPQPGDLSGNIGLGSREHLLDELASLDEKRAKIAREQGQLMLDAARERAIAAGALDPKTRQRHGNLVETLYDLEPDIRLLVIGKRGEDSLKPGQLVGSQLESTIRSMHRPILVTPREYQAPRSAMMAFDGSPTASKGVEMLAASPLLRGLPVHLVMVGRDQHVDKESLERAAGQLAAAGFEVHTAMLAGEVEPILHAYQAQHKIDLLAMGAYGHSRIREFLVGSTTSSMLRTTSTPLLMLR